MSEYDPAADEGEIVGPEYISRELWALAVSIDTVHPLDGNARVGDVEAVKRSLARFKQRKPIVATEDGTITAGNHTHAAAVALGWEEIAVVFEDDDPATARAFALADNRTGDLGRYDNDLLVASLVQVRDADVDLLLAASYTEEDVDDLLAFVKGPTKLDDDDGSGDDGGPDLTSCPNCGHVF